MLRKVIRKIITSFYRYRWAEGVKWLDKIRPVMFKEAEEFLIGRGYLKDGQTINDLAKVWPYYVKTLFNPSRPNEFYSSWVGCIGASNIAANTIDQLSRPYVAYALIKYLGSSFNGILLDFGCGTATITLAWHKEIAKCSTLILSDLENLPREFVRYYICKYQDNKIRLVDTKLSSVPNAGIDVVLCIDVLEHLQNPSSVFKLLHSKLKDGGIMILQAPFGGQHPEHLKESLIDWRKNGGYELLKTCYQKIAQLNPFYKLSGIFRKNITV